MMVYFATQSNFPYLRDSKHEMASNVPTNTPREFHVETTWNDRFYVVSTWNPRGVFVGVVVCDLHLDIYGFRLAFDN